MFGQPPLLFLGDQVPPGAGQVNLAGQQ